MGKIFGGSSSSSQSTSSNQAFPMLQDQLGGVVGQAGQGANALSAFLGGDTSGFDTYKDATGFDFAAEQGSRGITGNSAARGLLRSGGTGKKLVQFGNDIQQQYAGNYLDRLLGQAGLGLQAGSTIASAGQVGQSSQNSKSKPGLGGFIGSALSGVAASDRRLKKNIVKVGQVTEGINLYTFDYINEESSENGPAHVGVMADEVEKVYPEALGPVIDGYATVDYDALKGVAA